MTWLRVALVFLLGIAIGAFVRIKLPPPKPSLRPVGERARARAAVARAAPPSAPTAAGTTAQMPGEPSTERVYEVLDAVGLKPRGDDPRYVSWLYVRAPEAWLLKSQDYVDSVLAGRESQVLGTVGPLFAELELGAEATATLRRTLAEMLQARSEIEVLGAATDPPLTPAQVETLFSQSDDEYRAKIRSQLGPANFERFENFFATLPTRDALRPLFNEIAIFATPLTFAERNALVAAAVAEAQGGDPAANDGQIAPEKLAIVQQWRRAGADRARLLALIGTRDFERTRPPELGKSQWRPIYSRATAPGAAR